MKTDKILPIHNEIVLINEICKSLERNKYANRLFCVAAGLLEKRLRPCEDGPVPSNVLIKL